MVTIYTTFPKTEIERYNAVPPKDTKVIYASNKDIQKDIDAFGEDIDFMFTSGPLTRADIEKLPNLKLIHTIGVGYDSIDIVAAREHGIDVCNSKGVNSKTVAEFTIGLMLGLTRKIVFMDESIRKDRYRESKSTYLDCQVKELFQSQVGIIGLGSIGIELAKRLKAFGSTVVYYSRTRKEDIENELDITYMTLDELFRTSDIISIHTPLTESTNQLIDEKVFKIMKNEAIIINTGRGKIIKEDDLVKALINKEIGGVALDTYEKEPPDFSSPLFHLPEEIAKNVVFTPHVAGITSTTFAQVPQIAFDNIERVIQHKEPIHIVNK